MEPIYVLIVEIANLSKGESINDGGVSLEYDKIGFIKDGRMI